jgi:ApeA N-terminal domain 1
MSERFTPEELRSRPIMGTWSIEGAKDEYPGFLYLKDDNLRLTLYLTIVGSTPFDVVARTDPRLVPFVPPNQPTLHGQTKAAGYVTLFNCAQLNYQSSNQLSPPQARVELTLQPTQAWIGGGFVSAEKPYCELSFRAPGLHNILSTLHIDHEFLMDSKPKRKSATRKLKKLTGAHQAFLVHQHAQSKARVVRARKSYEIALATSISQSSSSTDGITIQTSDSVSIQSEGANLAELMGIAFDVEQFLSLLCVGPFRGKQITVRLDNFQEAELLWSLGKPVGQEPFRLMPHQMLVPLGRHSDLAKQALERWFDASEPTQLARWLIFDALFNEASSTAKFLSVAQAWEIAGREESKVAPYDRRKFKKVCTQINKIICDELGASAAKRLLELLRSSNREGFANFVKHMTDKLPEPALKAVCQDVPTFVSTVVSVRNVLTHMQGSKKMPFENASYLSLFLTFKLIVLFCIYACVSMGLPLDNLVMMLANNAAARAACRPLPVI